VCTGCVRKIYSFFTNPETQGWCHFSTSRRQEVDFLPRVEFFFMWPQTFSYFTYVGTVLLSKSNMYVWTYVECRSFRIQIVDMKKWPSPIGLRILAYVIKLATSQHTRWAPNPCGRAVRRGLFNSTFSEFLDVLQLAIWHENVVSFCMYILLCNCSWQRTPMFVRQ
jgi:hypothetical protein